jgi:endoglucanase
MTRSAIALAFALAALAACGGGSGSPAAPSTPVGTGGTTTGSTSGTGTTTNAACAAGYAPPVASAANGLAFCASLATMPDKNGVGTENGQSCQARTAFDIVKEMGQGWNLGNTLDANGDTADPLADETYWGNPKTSQALVDAVHKAGFTTMRIPVSWDDHMSGAARTIDPAWMDRVEQVVKYALADHMTVIVNIHHNNGWEAPTIANEENAKDTLTELWTQIATRFAGYDQHLVFEAMNEPRQTINGADDWVGTVQNYDVINHLNAAALAAIRATGGNNARRLVMLPSYAAAPDQQLDAMVMPADPMIALSDHAYRPWSFAGDQKGTSVFTGQAELDQLFARLNTKFVAQGIPVVIGEWASTDKNNADERVKHASYFVKGARQYGIPTVWWDNGNKTLTSTATDVMALVDRSNNTVAHQEIVDAIFCAAK